MEIENIGLKCKKWMKGELVDLFQRNESIIVTNFRNLNVEEQEELRKELRKQKSYLMVVKNSICKRAFNDLDLKELSQLLQGSCAVVLGKNNSIKIAKVLFDFADEYPGFNVKGGLINQEIYSDKKIEDLSELPSKEVLLGKLVGSIGAPTFKFLQILDMQIRRIVYAFLQIRDKKSE